MSETTATTETKPTFVIPSKSKIRHVDILNTIRQSHLQNGLRTDDYARYRKYCSRHINRTRHAIKVSLVPRSQTKRTHRTAPQKLIRSTENPTSSVNQAAIIPTTTEVHRDTRYAEIQLALAERAWAYWMELRGDGTAGKTSASGVADEHTRVYYHLIKRLKKAVSWAEVLECLCLTGYVDKKINVQANIENDDDDDDDENVDNEETKLEDEKKPDDVTNDVMNENPQAKKIKGKSKLAELNKKYKGVPGMYVGSYLKDHFNTNNVRWCDERTAIEACIYASWMRGNLALETEKWNDAIHEFSISNLLCNILLSTEILPEKKVILQERIDEMEPQLRFAAYNARVTLSLPKSTADICPELSEIVDKVVTASGEVNSALFTKVCWAGRSIHVRNAVVRRSLEAMHKAAKCGGEIAGAYSKATSALHADLDSLTKKIAAKERFPAAVKALEQQKNDVVALVDYLHWIKAEKTCERNVVKARKMQFNISDGALSFKLVNSDISDNEKDKVDEIKQSKVDFKKADGGGEDGVEGEGEEKKTKKKDKKCVVFVSLNDIIKLYDVAIQSGFESELLLKKAKENTIKTKDSDDTTIVKEDENESKEKKMAKNAHEMAIRAERCYFVALTFLHKKKWSEAIALFERAQKLAGDATAHLNQCKEPQQDDLAVMKAVEAQSRSMRCIVIARASMKAEEDSKKKEEESNKKKKEGEEEEEAEEEEEVNVEEPLFEGNLDEWPSTLKQNRPFISMDLPKPEVLQCRPMLLDVAFNSVEYPDLTDRKKVSKGFFGKLW